MRVAEKVAIVTGGLSGIGAGVAARLARDGMIVVAADISTQSMELDRTLGIHPFHVDVADQDSVASLVRAVMATCGRVDCLVHCAGVGRVLPFLETPLGTFDLVLKTNLHGNFSVGQACARVMAAIRGDRPPVLVAQCRPKYLFQMAFSRSITSVGAYPYDTSFTSSVK